MANSIVTNVGAMAAVRTLTNVSNDMNKTSSRIESGLKVNKASDDPAVFAIAQGMRADQAGLQAVQDGLAFGKAALGVANSAAKKISDELTKIKQTLTQGQQQGLDATTMQNQIDDSLKNINQFAKSATFNGVNLLDATGGTDNQLTVLQDIKGNSMTVNGSGTTNATATDLGINNLKVAGSSISISFDNTAQIANGDTLQLTDSVSGKTWTFEFSDNSAPLQSTPGPDDLVFDVQVDPTTQSLPQMVGAMVTKLRQEGFGAKIETDGSLTITGNNIDGSTTTLASGGATDSVIQASTNQTAPIAAIDNAISAMNTKLSELGGATRQVEGMQDFSKSLMDSLKEGLGALVDADLAEESAKL